MDRHRVAIIGAGPAGIVALRFMLHPPRDYDVTVFERSDRVGGIWNYDISKGPMYRNLRTNLPIPVMSFHDYPFIVPEHTSFPTHEQVLAYINSYLDHLNARHLIRFNTEVTSVVPILREDKVAKWVITTSGEEGKEEAVFDTVFVCNGHYEVTNIPSIPGIEAFKGSVIHSIKYKVPETFAGQKVVLLGARSSGQDIAVDLSAHAKEVVLSHGGPELLSKLPANISQMSPVVEFSDKAFVCRDGETIADVDAFIFCTGYRFAFPFLDERCGVSAADGWCHPLWKQFVNIAHPSMFLIGLCHLISPMPLFAMQCALARAIVDGRFKLPSAEAMRADEATDYQQRVVQRGLRPSKFHQIAEEQWSYNDDLAELAKFPPLPRYIGSMYKKCSEKRETELTQYRKYFFRTVSDDEFLMSSTNGCD